MFSNLQQTSGFNVSFWIDKAHLVSSWWWRTVLASLPSRWSKILQASKRPQLLLRVVDDHLMCILDGAESQRCLEKIPIGETYLASYDWESMIANPELTNIPAVLMLENDQVLSQSVILPVEAEQNLDQLFAYDMDRLTPVSVDEVYYDYQIIRRDKARGKITVLLHVVMRKAMDDLLNQLSSMRLPLHGIDVIKETSGAGFQSWGVNLLPVARMHPLSRRELWVSLALTLAALCIVGMIQLFTLQIKNERIALWEQQLTVLNKSAATVIELKKQVDEVEQATRFVVRKKLGSQSLTSVLYHLTQTLPDNTYIQQLYVKDNEVELHGLSGAAASLIPLLEDSSWFYQAVLRAPVTREKASAKERYKIRVGIDVDAQDDFNRSIAKKASAANLDDS